MQKHWVILDRDGVINIDSDDYIKSVAEWQPIPGSIEAIAALSKAGFIVTVATNQSGIARGYFTLDTLHEMHEKMIELVTEAGGHIAALAYCPHGPDEDCACRKPKPGLLETLATQMGLNLKDAYFVGDTYKDVEAAKAVGATPILVKTGKGERTLAKHPKLNTTVSVFEDLHSFAKALLIGKIA